MLKQFYPGRCAASAYGLPYGDFYSRGIRGVIFDIDNTLVPHGAPADDRARALFKELQEMGMNTCLMSNNKEPRRPLPGRSVPVICSRPGSRGGADMRKR